MPNKSFQRTPPRTLRVSAPLNSFVMRKNKIFKIILILLVPILTILYGCGDYFGFWDVLSGRTNALTSYNRLSSTKGYPEIYIKDSNKEFPKLYKFLIKHIQEPSIQNLNKQGLMPKAIVRLGGTMGHELKKQMPPDYPDVRFVSDTLPILFIYEYTREKDNAIRACSLGDLKNLIEKLRNRENFLVLTLLLGLLSIIVAVLEIKEKSS